MAAGTVFALAMREVDLSVGGVYALGVNVGAICIRKGWSPWAAAVAVLAMSAVLGAGNAGIATYLGLPTFITTLATGIRVNSIHPGPTDTPFVYRLEAAATGQAPERAAKAFNEAIPLGRHATAEEIARTVLYLAGDDASFATGTVAVDGGMSV